MSPWVKLMAGYERRACATMPAERSMPTTSTTVPGQEGADVAWTAPEVADGVTLFETPARVAAANLVRMSRSNGLWSSSWRKAAA